MREEKVRGEGGRDPKESREKTSVGSERADKIEGSKGERERKTEGGRQEMEKKRECDSGRSRCQ